MLLILVGTDLAGNLLVEYPGWLVYIVTLQSPMYFQLEWRGGRSKVSVRLAAQGLQEALGFESADSVDFAKPNGLDNSHEYFNTWSPPGRHVY